MPRGSNKGRSFAPETVPGDEARRLLAACNRGATGARNRALLVLMYGGGLRVGEALKLRPEHVDVAAGVIRVRAGKGVRRVRGQRTRKAAPRTVAVGPTWAGVLAAWQQVRDRLAMASTAPFLCTLDGQPVLASYARSLCKRLAQKAGVDPARVHPHALRHSFAAELARAGLPMNAVQAALGHSSLATTSVYLAHVAPDELVSMLRVAREPQTAAA